MSARSLRELSSGGVPFFNGAVNRNAAARRSRESGPLSASRFANAGTQSRFEQRGAGKRAD